MEIAEIRDLDGPNVFLLKPAIKIEFAFDDDRAAIANNAFELVGSSTAVAKMEDVDANRVLTVVTEIVNELHDRCGQKRPDIVSRTIEEPGHAVVAFSWSHRRFARQLARCSFNIVSGESFTEADVRELYGFLANSDPDDAPEMLLDKSRTIPVIAITGTNGKTTTTRLVSSILMHAGKRVGWTSSSGVLIQGKVVLEGDFTGPAGAARVFEEPDLDVAVLETARGGILLRGIGFESSDVSVVTNVSSDHLGLHGIHTVDGLTEVKAIVARIARPGGFAILNADDPLVLAVRDQISARPFLISRRNDAPEVVTHINDGGWALVIHEDLVQWHHDHEMHVLTDLNDIPISFGGRAQHMLENALCAGAACLAIGMTVDQVRTGLAAFRNESSQNRGRLNVYDIDGVMVIVDFAHNELGLKHLLDFAKQMATGRGDVISVIGTAGDRANEVFSALGTIAARSSDRIVLKDTEKYLRGRQPGEMLTLLGDAVKRAGVVSFDTAPSELTGFHHALEIASPGDIVAVMCIEDYDTIIPELEAAGRSLS